MTGKELSRLYHLNREIARLTGALDRLKQASKHEGSCDRVKASYQEFPYTEHFVTIYGLPAEAFVNNNYDSEIEEVKTLLEINIKKSIFERVRLERFIHSIVDPETRQIMALRHINGLSWKQVAISVGCYASEDSVRMLHNRYLKEK